MRGSHSGVTGPAHTLRSRQTEIPGGRADAAPAGQGGEELVLLLLGGGPSGRRICAGPAGDGAGLVGPMEAGLNVDAQRPGREAHALHPVQQGKEPEGPAQARQVLSLNPNSRAASRMLSRRSKARNNPARADAE